MYPKKSYELAFNFKSDTINRHNISIPGLISSFGKFIASRFRNPFSRLTTTTTTTEASSEIEKEVNDDGTDSFKSDSGVDSASGEYDNSSNEYVTPDGSNTGYDYNTYAPEYALENAELSYLPPDSVRSTYQGSDSYLPPQAAESEISYQPSN